MDEVLIFNRVNQNVTLNFDTLITLQSYGLIGQHAINLLLHYQTYILQNNLNQSLLTVDQREIYTYLNWSRTKYYTAKKLLVLKGLIETLPQDRDHYGKFNTVNIGIHFNLNEPRYFNPVKNEKELQFNYEFGLLKDYFVQKASKFKKYKALNEEQTLIFKEDLKKYGYETLKKYLVYYFEECDDKEILKFRYTMSYKVFKSQIYKIILNLKNRDKLTKENQLEFDYNVSQEENNTTETYDSDGNDQSFYEIEDKNKEIVAKTLNNQVNFNFNKYKKGDLITNFDKKIIVYLGYDEEHHIGVDIKSGKSFIVDDLSKKLLIPYQEEPILGYNIDFDKKFLKKEAKKSPSRKDLLKFVLEQARAEANDYRVRYCNA